ncbi:hypothetical protein [Pseudenterobacter timonensis]|uniref:Uncharacterized protein n=1 Tax=Pseudenterobacter timonensis TaxID=1755099 RepID=A0ABV4A6K5_9ENTR
MDHSAFLRFQVINLTSISYTRFHPAKTLPELTKNVKFGQNLTFLDSATNHALTRLGKLSKVMDALSCNGSVMTSASSEADPLKIKLSALLLAIGSGSAQGQGALKVEYQSLTATMTWVAHTNETALNHGISQRTPLK